MQFKVRIFFKDRAVMNISESQMLSSLQARLWMGPYWGLWSILADSILISHQS